MSSEGTMNFDCLCISSKVVTVDVLMRMVLCQNWFTDLTSVCLFACFQFNFNFIGSNLGSYCLPFVSCFPTGCGRDERTLMIVDTVLLLKSCKEASLLLFKARY